MSCLWTESFIVVFNVVLSKKEGEIFNPSWTSITDTPYEANKL